MAKANFLNQADLFVRIYISLLYGNSHKNPENEGTSFRE